MAGLKNRMDRALQSFLHPPKYTAYSLLVSLGGLLFGLDTGCIGPVTTMPQFLATVGPLSSTVHGLVVSSILIPAALASFFAGGLADFLGRPRTVGLGGLIFALGCALEASAAGLPQLFVGRIITGVGEGLFMSVMTVYVCELAPAQERGMLASIQQFLTTVGICAGYFICFGTVRTDDSSTLAWRLPFALMSFLSLLYAILVLLFLPQSPRWLETKGRKAEADAIWDALGISAASREKASRQAADDALSLTEALALTQAPTTTAQTTARPNALEIFHPSVLSRTLLGAFLMAIQQLSGIDGVLFYAPLLFQSAGLTSSTASFLASGISALLMTLVTVPAFLLADRWGRRTSTLAGGVLLSATMLLIGALYAAGAVHPAAGPARWLVVALIYAFALTYCATWAVGIRVYAAEIQPVRTRAPATSLAQSANWLANWLVAFTTPIFLARSASGVYFLFGACSALAVLVCALAMPETKGRTLEEIDAVFERRRADKVLNVTGLTRLVARRRRGRRGSDGGDRGHGIELQAL